MNKDIDRNSINFELTPFVDPNTGAQKYRCKCGTTFDSDLQAGDQNLSISQFCKKVHQDLKFNIHIQFT